MKRKIRIFIAFITLSIYMSACIQEKNNIKQSQDAVSDKLVKNIKRTNNIDADYERYTKNIKVIDRSLSKYKNNYYKDVRFGTFSGYYYFSNLTSIGTQDVDKPSDYYPDGEIISYFKDDNLKGFRMEIGWNTSGSYQKGGDYKYQCENYLIRDDMVYYSFSTDSDDKKEIPTFMCIDGITQIQNDMGNQNYTDSYALKRTIYDKEYISIAGIIYEINRREQTIRKVEDNTSKAYINWCNCQQREILNAQKSFKTSSETVQTFIPKGYKLINSNDYSVADRNLV